MGRRARSARASSPHAEAFIRAAPSGWVHWAWNDHLEPERLLEQMDALVDAGYAGAVISSESGLATPFLGPEWWEAVRGVAERARDRGFGLRLADDERGGPTGTAGGRARDGGALHVMRVREQDSEQPLLQDGREETVAFSLHRRGSVLLSAQYLPPGEAPAAGKLLLFDLLSAPALPRFNGAPFSDVLDPEAASALLRAHHEVCESELGPLLGGTVRGFVTCPRTFNGADLDRGVAVGLPWAGGLAAEVSERHGVDLIARLPELVYRREDGRHRAVRWAYRETLAARFRRGFVQPLARWCDGRGLELTAATGAASLASQARSVGAAMRIFELVHEPALRVRGLEEPPLLAALQCVSTARVTGRRARVDLCRGAGWDASWADLRRAAEQAYALGFTERTVRGAVHSLRGGRKRDHPAPPAATEHHRLLETTLSRVAELLGGTTPEPEVAVLHPIESGWSLASPMDDGSVRELDRALEAVVEALLDDHRQVDLMDEDQAARMGVAELRGGAPTLKLGPMAYRALVIPPVVRLRSETRVLVERFLELGGPVVVVRAGAPRDLAPEPDSAALLSDRRVHPLPVGGVRDVLPVALEQLLGRTCSVSSPDGAPEIGVRLRRARIGDRQVLHLVSREPGAALPLRIRAEGTYRLWEPETGTSSPVEEDGDEILLTLPAGGSALLVEAAAGDPQEALDPAHPLAAHVAAARTLAAGSAGPLPVPDGYELDGVGALPLDRARWAVEGRPWSEVGPLWHAERALRRQAGLPWDPGGVGAQPWSGPDAGDASRQLGAWELDEGRPSEARQSPLPFTVSLLFHVRELPPDPVALILERPERVRAILNGATLGDARSSAGAAGSAPCRHVRAALDRGFWLDPALRAVDASGTLVVGENTLVIEGLLDESLELETPFLIGALGSRPSERVIEGLPERLAYGDAGPAGLAHHVGALVFRWDLEPRRGHHVLEILPEGSSPGAVCYEVRLSGRSVGRVPWAPYRVDLGRALEDGGRLEVACEGSLRNLLGPLHSHPHTGRREPDVPPPAVSPRHFRPEPGSSLDRDGLAATGLLVPPRLIRVDS